MDLSECIKKGHIKKTLVNHELIKSLLVMSKNNEITVRKALLDQISVSSYITLAYDSLRQSLEALCILKGFKVVSHICLGEFLRDNTDNFDYDQFDRFRWIRNSINYYGKVVELKQGKELIEKMLMMKKEIIKIHLKDFETHERS